MRLAEARVRMSFAGRDFLNLKQRRTLFLPHSWWRKWVSVVRAYSVKVGSLLRPFIVIGFISGATAAIADPVPLANDELKTTVSGSIVEIDTPLGTTVPMRFGTDG